MSESVQFWLDNKMSAGLKVATIGEQVLVVYREKFYVVEKDAAHTKGGKPLRYSKSSLPAIWKRAFRGETLPAEVLIIPPDDALPVSTITKRKRVKKESPQEPSVTLVAHQSPVLAPSTKTFVSASEPKTLKTVKKSDMKSATQATVIVGCPHCNHRHELPLERGKNGKPFFMACAKCTVDFAVRFVPVMMYQAQVAGFN